MATQPQFLVLAAGPSGMAAVDVANGALVRASWQGRTEEQLSPYDVVTAAVAPFDQDAGVTFAPEAVSLSSPPRKVGSLHRRAADKLVRGVVHPPRQPLFGFPGATAPFWTLSGDRPSIAVIEPEIGPVVERGKGGYRCSFRWRKLDHVLPLDDQSVGAALLHPCMRKVGALTLGRMLGWEPRRLIVALTPPVGGHCYKVVAGILPGR
ncbi:MAG: hypothetical protein ACLGHT_13260 [Acidimicrobiia bacterium]